MSQCKHVELKILTRLFYPEHYPAVVAAHHFVASPETQLPLFLFRSLAHRLASLSFDHPGFGFAPRRGFSGYGGGIVLRPLGNAFAVVSFCPLLAFKRTDTHFLDLQSVERSLSRFGKNLRQTLQVSELQKRLFSKVTPFAVNRVGVAANTLQLFLRLPHNGARRRGRNGRFRIFRTNKRRRFDFQSRYPKRGQA